MPSPPLGVHERGSQGASGVTEVLGAAKAPLLDEEPEFPVAPAPVEPVVLVPPVAADVGVDVGAAAGGLTLNWVPVTTVTCEPGLT